MAPKISIIVALAEHRVIGRSGKIPWHLPEDMKHFRDLTKGHVVVVGRKTYESIGKPLPHRTNIVVTRERGYEAPGCIVSSSFDEALQEAKVREQKEIFIIGGGEIYKEAMPYADKLYLTLVEKEFEGDTFFPDYSEFKKVISETSGVSGDLKYKFVELEK